MRHLTINLETEIKNKLDELLPWGSQSKFLRVIINDIIVALSDESLRERIIAGVMTGRIKAQDISDILKEEGD